MLAQGKAGAAVPELGNIKPCLLTSCCQLRLPTHFILWMSSIIGAAFSSPPSGVLKGKGGSRPDERGQMVL